MPQSPLITLADVLSAQESLPSVRLGKITAIDKSSSVWMVDLEVEGSTSTRRARWLGDGGQPAVGMLVTYMNESPIPTVLGRVSSDLEDQNFGNGTVTAGAVVDAQGNLRTGINGAFSSAADAQNAADIAYSSAGFAQSTANTAYNSAGAAQGTAWGAESAANNAQNTANAAYDRTTTALGSIDNLNNSLYYLQIQMNSLTSSLTNNVNWLQTQINSLQAQVNNNLAYAQSLEATLISYLGAGGPDD